MVKKKKTVKKKVTVKKKESPAAKKAETRSRKKNVLILSLIHI